MRVDEVSIGDCASIEKRFTGSDNEGYSVLVEDFNPLHLDDEYAKNTRFGRKITHGLLVAGLISGVLGTQLPGEGSIYVSQTLSFKRPVFVGDVIKAEVTVTAVDYVKHIVTLRTCCINQDGKLVIEGEAVIFLDE
jgi:acyl dehydratase